MVRVFHGGEDGQHDYKLYDLSKDIGEKRNLAAAMPERVQKLDRMIESYLRETGAVIPKPNPGGRCWSECTFSWPYGLVADGSENFFP